MDEYGSVVKICDKKYLTLDFDDLELLVYLLSEKIKGSEYKPTKIVGISRWGNDTANRVSGYLGLDTVLSIGYQGYYDVDKAADRKSYQSLTESIEDEKILLVDELAQTGKTLEAALHEQILPMNPVEVRTATMIIKPQTRPRPDYWIMLTDKWALLRWKMCSNVLDLLKTHTKTYELEKVISEVSEKLYYPEYAINRGLQLFQESKEIISEIEL